MKRYFTVLLLSIMILVGSALSDGWQIESVDTSGYSGYYTSIALDSDDYPHISYYDYYPNYDLKYARWDGSSWQTESVDTSGDVGNYTSIALDSDDYPHIAYYDGTNDDLKYTRWDGSSWQTESVDTEGMVGWFISIALDSDDHPHISYYDFTNGDLKYTRWDGSSWQTESVDTSADVGYYTSITLDGDDYPHISYYDFTNGDLKYARWDGSSWQTETVDTTGNVGWYTSIALDGDEYPHISYYLGSNFSLKYAKWDGSSWHTESVDTSGYVGSYSSIALDGDEYPHISYLDDYNSDLKYAKWDGSSWQTESVDTSGSVGSYTSIALDGGDNPHISYLDIGNLNLKYAFYNTPPCAFNLLSPPHESYVNDPPTLDWEDADDPQDVIYDLWYSTETDFDPHYEVNDLTDSIYTFGEGDLTQGEAYHWKVVASDGYEETWCTAPDGGGDDEYWTFTVNYSDIELTTFSAVDKGGQAIVLNWSAEATEGEHIQGFNLYRREMGLQEITLFSGSEDTHPRLYAHLDEDWTRINSSLITGDNPYTYIDDTVERGITYEYQLEAVVEEEPTTLGTTQGMCGLPTSFAITSIHPNPTTDEVKITLSTPETTDVNIEVYDITGRLVKTISIGEVESGGHTEVLSTIDLSSGVYTVKASAGDEQSTQKMVVVR